MRNAVLLTALAVVVLLGVLTVSVIVAHGLDPLTIVSLLILGMLGIGLYGAVGEDDSEGGD
jgi:hypothetical protein